MESYSDTVRAAPDLARKVADESIQQSQEVLRQHMKVDHGGMLMLGICVTCHTLTATIERHNLVRREIEVILNPAP